MRPSRASPERAGLDDVIGKPQVSIFVLAANVAAIRARLIVNEVQAVSEEEFRLPGVKLLGNKGERSRQIKVVRVEPAENDSRRQREAFVDCVSLATILFTFPVRQVALVFLDDLDAVVGAP